MSAHLGSSIARASSSNSIVFLPAVGASRPPAKVSSARPTGSTRCRIKCWQATIEVIVEPRQEGTETIGLVGSVKRRKPTAAWNAVRKSLRVRLSRAIVALIRPDRRRAGIRQRAGLVIMVALAETDDGRQIAV